MQIILDLFRDYLRTTATQRDLCAIETPPAVDSPRLVNREGPSTLATTIELEAVT